MHGSFADIQKMSKASIETTTAGLGSFSKASQAIDER